MRLPLSQSGMSRTALGVTLYRIFGPNFSQKFIFPDARFSSELSNRNRIKQWTPTFQRPSGSLPPLRSIERLLPAGYTHHPDGDFAVLGVYPNKTRAHDAVRRKLYLVSATRITTEGKRGIAPLPQITLGRSRQTARAGAGFLLESGFNGFFFRASWLRALVVLLAITWSSA